MFWITVACNVIRIFVHQFSCSNPVDKVIITKKFYDQGLGSTLGITEKNYHSNAIVFARK